MADKLLTRNEFVREMNTRDEQWRADMNARDERMRDAFNVQTETLREVIQNWGGFGAALERVERTVREIHRDINAKRTLHDHVLKDHATRIAALERGEGGG